MSHYPAPPRRAPERRDGILGGIVHFHWCPIHHGEYEHDNASRVGCCGYEDECWPCRLERMFPPSELPIEKKEEEKGGQ